MSNTWVEEVAAPVPPNVVGAERLGIRNTPALAAWIVENAREHDLSLLPYDDAGPFVRRYRVPGSAGYLYQLGGRAVFADPEGNRLFVAVLSTPKRSLAEAIQAGWVMVDGARYGLPIESGARMAQRTKAAALHLLARYGHLLGAEAWVQVPNDKCGVSERRVKDLRAPERRPLQSVKVSGQVWNRARRTWAHSTPKLSPGGLTGVVVVAPNTPLVVQYGERWVSLHDRQTGECLYRFLRDEWQKYERKFSDV